MYYCVYDGAYETVRALLFFHPPSDSSGEVNANSADFVIKSCRRLKREESFWGRDRRSEKKIFCMRVLQSACAREGLSCFVRMIDETSDASDVCVVLLGCSKESRKMIVQVACIYRPWRSD